MNRLIQIIGTTLALSQQYRSLAALIPDSRMRVLDEPTLRPGAFLPPVHHGASLEPRWMSGLGAESSQWGYGGYELDEQPIKGPGKIQKRSQSPSKLVTSSSSGDRDTVAESAIVLRNPNTHSQPATLEPSKIVLKKSQQPSGLSSAEKSMLSRRADRTTSSPNINPSRSNTVLTNTRVPSSQKASDSADLASKIVLDHPMRPRAAGFSNVAVSASKIVLRKNQGSSNGSLTRRASNIGSGRQVKVRNLKRSSEPSSTEPRSSRTTVVFNQLKRSQKSSSSQVPTPLDSKIVLSNPTRNQEGLSEPSNVATSSSPSL